jgi:hypothetical protein
MEIDQQIAKARLARCFALKNYVVAENCLRFPPVLLNRTPLSLDSIDMHQTGVHKAIFQTGKPVPRKFATENQTS